MLFYFRNELTLTKTIQFYNTISPVYWLIDLFLWKGKKQVCNQLNQLPKGQLLEAGVGNGSHLHLLGNHNAYGIDVSDKMLTKAKKRKLSNVILSRQNAEKTDFKNTEFDYILLSHVLSVTESPELLLLECYRLLKPSGKLFILNHNTSNGLSKFLDRIFHSISGIFNYSSYFCIDKLASIQLFTKLNEQSVFMNNYITIRQYQK